MSGAKRYPRIALFPAGAAMLIRKNPNGIDLPFPSEITPREVYEGRRAFLARVAAGAVVGSSLWEMANREAFAKDRIDLYRHLGKDAVINLGVEFVQ